jgi:hypothetical protein
VVVAEVDGQPIYGQEVLRQLDPTADDGGLDAGQRALQRATALEYLIAQRLVLAYLARKGLGPSEQDVDFLWEQQRRRLAQREVQLEDHLRQRGLDRDAYRRRLAWRLGWPRYVQRYLTDENLQKQFASRPRDYDGTQLRVAHILLRVPRSDGPAAGRAAVDRSLSRAQEIRRRIDSGELSFAEAARKYSDAPTAPQGGDLGYLSRHQPMPEAFTRAAFGLQPGQTSDPVVSPFGVHLIHCLQVKPGHGRWTDVRDRLRKDLTRRVFTRLVAIQRQRTKVVYSGAMPYLDPATGRLVDGDLVDGDEEVEPQGATP